jgi:hypothetical protein
MKRTDGGITADKILGLLRCEQTGGKAYAKKLKAKMSRTFRLGESRMRDGCRKIGTDKSSMSYF